MDAVRQAARREEAFHTPVFRLSRLEAAAHKAGQAADSTRKDAKAEALTAREETQA